ncbi:alpha/beta hydrolase [Paenibacillus arenilitoris]|uniref:Alpha/beta hydrolase n=1 Tax=Paenibacillus arenilitoris TaxID=2772299 RepID=A0A927CGY9_9BACL|nr:alpha/beta hydrolase [Paenibacillus arenilitoris]MBD2867913.1 alpha/beta hydrolase [Paenibacillus arenilitoris]
MQREEWGIIGAKGTELFVREWNPDDLEASAVVCIVHGIGEHGDRYSHVASLLTKAGMAAIALDQHGHGRSSGKRGHIHSLDAAASDAALIVEQARTKHPDAPVFLYGHSMGGNVALNCALRLRPRIRGLILSSPWLRLAFKPNAAAEWLGKKLVRVLPGLQQSTGLNSADLFRPGYSVAPPVAGDLFCHTKITLRTYDEITSGGEWALAECGRLQVPTLLMHGTSDRITSIEASRQLSDSLGPLCERVEIEGGYHELHNDLGGEDTILKMIGWMKRQL